MKVLKKLMFVFLTAAWLSAASTAQASVMGRFLGFMGRQVCAARSSACSLSMSAVKSQPSVFDILEQRQAQGYSLTPESVVKHDATFAKELLVEGVLSQLAWSFMMGIKNYVDPKDVMPQEIRGVLDYKSQELYGLPYAELMKRGQEQRREERRVASLNRFMQEWMRDSVYL